MLPEPREIAKREATRVGAPSAAQELRSWRVAAPSSRATSTAPSVVVATATSQVVTPIATCARCPVDGGPSHDDCWRPLLAETVHRSRVRCLIGSAR
jgi:hypothetical protein